MVIMLRRWVMLSLALMLIAPAAIAEDTSAMYDDPLKTLWETRKVEGGFWTTRRGDVKFDFVDFMNSRFFCRIAVNTCTAISRCPGRKPESA